MFITIDLTLYLPLENMKYIYVRKYIWTFAPPKRSSVFIGDNIMRSLLLFLRDFKLIVLAHILHESDT